jgi:hypothetical protein
VLAAVRRESRRLVLLARRQHPWTDSDLQAGVDKEGFGTQLLVGSNSILEARLGVEGPQGKSWFEIESPKRSAEELLAGYTRALGVAHLVEGHQHQEAWFEDKETRQAGEMFQWRGLLFLIDVGMSEQIGPSQGAVLHIQTGGRKAIAMCADGKETSIWDGMDPHRTGRAVVCQIRP